MKSIEPCMTHALCPKVCVIFPGALGDFICFLPALESLGRGATVDLFARSEFAELAPYGVAVRSLERSEISNLFRRELDANGAAERFFQRYDAVFSWFASGNPEFVLRLQSFTGGRAQVFPFRPPSHKGQQADYYLSCLSQKAAGSARPMVALREEAVRWCEDFWARHALLHGRPVLTIAPGSGAREKNWPAEFFLAVARWWRQATGGAVILLIGPVEEERGGFERLRGSGIVASNLTLSQAAALLSRSDVYLGNDSGISHLAAAVDVRTVALFGPSNHRQWTPRGDKVSVLRRGIDCSPCQEAVMKICPHRACLSEFPAERVISMLAQLPEVITLTR